MKLIKPYKPFKFDSIIEHPFVRTILPVIKDIEFLDFILEDEKCKYSVDSMGNVSLLECNPVLEKKKNQLVELCEKEGIYIKVTEDVRSIDRQNQLYAQGRTTPGNIVTNARGEDYSSMHQWGIAFDVCINEVGNAYDVNKLKRVGEIGKSIGLEWGGDWKDFPDSPHFQLRGYTIENLKDEYGDPGNFSKKWD